MKVNYRNFEKEMISIDGEKALDEMFSPNSMEAKWIQPTMKNKDELVDAVALAVEDLKKKSDTTVIIANGELRKLLEFFYEASGSDKEIYFLGDSLSTLEYQKAIKTMEKEDFNLIAISGGNESTEMICAFTLARKALLNKHSLEKAQERVYIIAPNGSSYFMKEAAENKYIRLHLQEGIKAPQWLMTPAVLFPVGVMGFDVKELAEGYENMVTSMIWDKDGGDLAKLFKLDKYAYYSEDEFKPLIEYIEMRTGNRFTVNDDETLVINLSVEETNRDIMTPVFPGCNPEGSLKLMAEDFRQEYIKACDEKKRAVAELRIDDFKAKSLGELIYFIEMTIALKNRLN